LSSAILYLAIIAIWAGVLIPRWLRRDTSQPIAEEAPGEMDAETGPEPDDAREYEDGERAAAAFGPVDSANRARILMARRRMLMMLGALAVAAFGIVLVNLAAWWVTIPPAGMLVGYLMLLREARHADAERNLAGAVARAEDRRRARERELAAEAAYAGRSSARPALPTRYEQAATARVIDISERVKDELYDQYADTERRAVGD
jgi:hypothetical protein